MLLQYWAGMGSRSAPRQRVYPGMISGTRLMKHSALSDRKPSGLNHTEMEFDKELANMLLPSWMFTAGSLVRT